MKDLNKQYDPKEVEEKWYSFWEKEGFFKPLMDKNKKPYCIVMPPPNVTGNLHMGHALFIIQDMLIRYKRMCGYDTLWLPGTDHAGISTQTVVEKHLIATEGKRRRDFTREEFLSHIWNWKEEKQEIILNQLQKIGCSCDWSKLRFTMGKESNKAVKTIFKKMFDDGFLYRGYYLVNWDPVTQTALADDEVEYEERDSSLWYFRYPIVGESSYVVIATTRPETLLGDTAVAIAPNDPKYAHLIDKKILLPIINREIPIVEDDYVDPEFGSGVVKITPAHDVNDYEIGKRHNLEMINIMNVDGTINENGAFFEGLKMMDAREKVVEEMEKLGLLEKVEPYKLRVGVSYRSKAIIEPYLSKQWFVNAAPFKEKLINAVKNKKVKLIPSHWESTYYYWINNLRDWCISRQLWWGHQIPVWYNKENPEKMICWDKEGAPPEVEENPDDWYQDEDVLDTWYSSGLWPFSVFGWPDKTEELEKFYPNSTLVTGHDILFFWVARMILMGEYALGKVPFKNAFIHGLIYGKSYWRKDTDGSITYLPYEERVKYDLGEKVPKDVFSKWEKMSKTKGNVIDPLEIIDSYGTDAMRIALSSSVTHARQIDLDRRKFDEYKNFVNKIWNGTRFIIQNVTDDVAPLTKEEFAKGLKKDLFTIEDKWILSKINEVIVKQNANIENFNFDLAATLPYDFFWNDFCAYYLELVKPVLYGTIGNAALRKNKQKLLVIILLDVIRLYHPIAPYITEEIFSIFKNIYEGIKLDKKADMYTQKTILALHSKACIIAPYPQLVDKKDISKIVEKKFNVLKDLIRSIRNIRAEMKIPLNEKTDIFFSSKSKANISLLKENLHFFKALLKVDKTEIVSEEKFPEIGSVDFLHGIKIMVPLSPTMYKKEKDRLTKEKGKVTKEITSLEQRLQNKDFLNKAPSEIVKKMQSQLEEKCSKLNEIEIKQGKFK